jgi:uncharacterized protein (DUF697 family)
MAESKEQAAKAAKIIRNHVLAAIGGGIIPMPVLDAAVLAGIQIRMLRRLAVVYEVEFSEQRANSIVGALLGVSATATAALVLGAIPVVGRVLAISSGGASTYALGQVFVKHFESGGTFITFDPERAKTPSGETNEEKKVETDYAGKRP